MIFVLPFLEKIKRVDTRTQVFEVPPQQILSTDSVTLTVDAVIYYRVFDPIRAACRVLDFNQVKSINTGCPVTKVLETNASNSVILHPISMKL